MSEQGCVVQEGLCNQQGLFLDFFVNLSQLELAFLGFFILHWVLSFFTKSPLSFLVYISTFAFKKSYRLDFCYKNGTSPNFCTILSRYLCYELKLRMEHILTNVIVYFQIYRFKNWSHIGKKGENLRVCKKNLPTELN